MAKDMGYFKILVAMRKSIFTVFSFRYFFHRFLMKADSRFQWTQHNAHNVTG